MARISAKSGIRKNFILSKELNEELISYADENYLSQNQVICLALNNFFTNQKMTRTFSNMANLQGDDFKKAFSDILIDGLKNQGLVVPSDKLL